jgi:predicted acylesterase/phospholipase RssA
VNSLNNPDLLLSSGFLAFARHLGVLEALAVKQITPAALVGTSSGALVGALWCAGMAPALIARLLLERSVVGWFGFQPRLWRGAVSTSRIQRELSRHLPRDFAELRVPLAVGVRDSQGQHRLIHEGALLEAVAASCAIPYLFAPVSVAGELCSDGGAVDRLGLAAYRRWRPDRSLIVHEVERSRGQQPAHDGAATLWLRSPRSAAGLFGYGAFHFEKEQSRTVALAALSQLL